MLVSLYNICFLNKIHSMLIIYFKGLKFPKIRKFNIEREA